MPPEKRCVRDTERGWGVVRGRGGGGGEGICGARGRAIMLEVRRQNKGFRKVVGVGVGEPYILNVLKGVGLSAHAQCLILGVTLYSVGMCACVHVCVCFCVCVCVCVCECVCVCVCVCLCVCECVCLCLSV